MLTVASYQIRCRSPTKTKACAIATTIIIVITIGWIGGHTSSLKSPSADAMRSR